MATEKKLDCVILGLLSHEELSGYEIKKRMDTTLHYFWGASYGSIYPTLHDLLRRGLATKAICIDSKRKKDVYQISEQGRIYLREWLSLPVDKDELRYETLLKLFFGNELGKEGVMQHIDTFQTKISSQLQQLRLAQQRLQACLAKDPAHQYYELTVAFGIQSYEAYLSWCERAKAILTELEET